MRPQISRRSVLAVPALALVASQLAAESAHAGGKRSGLRVRGADLSFTPQLEAVGVKFSDGGAARPVERILARHSATHVRLRVWNNPPAGYSDAAAALAMAKRGLPDLDQDNS